MVGHGIKVNDKGHRNETGGNACSRNTVFGYGISNAIFFMSLKVTMNSQIDIFSYFVWILLQSCDRGSIFRHIYCIFEEYS